MSDLVVRGVPEGDLEIIRALAEERQESLQDFLLEVIRERALSASNRTRLSVIEARLKRMPPSTYTVEDLLEAKDAPRRTRVAED